MKEFFKKHWFIFFIVLIIWFLIFAVILFVATDLNFTIIPNMSLERLGVLGDSLNIVTSLFTGLAFAGVIVSVVLQTQELKEAREVFKGQQETLENQEFDNKFFQMLNLFNNIKKQFDTKKFEGLIIDLSTKIIQLQEDDNLVGKFKKDKTSYFKEAFREFNNENNTTFTYYFINLYQILNYMDKHLSDDFNSAKEYTNILRAQLSKNELILLLFNAIGVEEFNDSRYKKLVEKYAFFEHLTLDDIFNKDFLTSGLSISPGSLEALVLSISQYDESAFGNNKELFKAIQQAKIAYENK